MPKQNCSCKSKGDNSAVDEQDFDPNCDPNNPRRISIQDVRDAHKRMNGMLVYTPCVKSHMSDIFGMEIYLKMDLFQYTGSFKERGALNGLLKLDPEKKKLGVVCASAGNFGQAMAYHGGRLGIDVTVVMPTIAPMMKVQKCKKYKANVVLTGDNVGMAKREGLRIAKEKGITYFNGFDHCDILAGNGGLVIELLEQVKSLDAVVVPVGGGGLIAGVGTAIKSLSPKTKLIAAIPEKCLSLEASLKAGKSVPVTVSQTLADGQQVPQLGVNSFFTIKNLLDKVVKVKEEHIAVAMLRLIELEKIVAEGAGASALAAIFSGQLDEYKGKKIALIVSGGNVDTTILRRCLDRGMAAEGRMVKVKCQLIDRPGNLTELCQMINGIGVAIKDIFHERAWIFSDVFSVIVKLICETRDRDHALELRQLLTSKYEDVHFLDFPEDYIPPPLY